MEYTGLQELDSLAVGLAKKLLFFSEKCLQLGQVRV